MVIFTPGTLARSWWNASRLTLTTSRAVFRANAGSTRLDWKSRQFLRRRRRWRVRHDLTVPDCFRLPLVNEINLVPKISLLEDGFTRLEIFGQNFIRLKDADLGDVVREKQIQRPVGGDADLAVEAGEFAQVNRPPEEPGEPAGQLDPENFRETAIAARREPSLPRPVNVNGVFFASPRICAAIFVSQVFAWRIACWAVGGESIPSRCGTAAIAQRRRPACRRRHEFVHLDPVFFHRDGERFEQRMCRGGDSRHHRSRCDRFGFSGRLRSARSPDWR